MLLNFFSAGLVAAGALLFAKSENTLLPWILCGAGAALYCLNWLVLGN